MRGALGAACLYALLTPWVLRPWFLAADALPHFGGLGGGLFADADLSLNIWILAWVAHALLTDPSRLFDGNIYHPAGGAIVGSENMLAHAPVTVPVLWATGNALLVLKAMVLESFVLAGTGMFLLVRRRTGSGAAALVAGAAYAFTPWRTNSIPQPQYLGSAWLPLALLAVDVWLERRRPAALVGLAAALAMQGLACVYLGYFAFACVPLYALARVLTERRDGGVTAIAGAAIGTTGGALALLPVMWPYLRARAAGVIPSHDPSTILRFSASPATILGPELFVWMGVVGPALALLGLLRRHDRNGPATRATWVLVGVAVLLAFGPWRLVGGTWVPLPAALLYAVAPGFGSIRAPIRFLLIAAAGLCMLGGSAFAAATATWSRRGRALAAAVAIAVTVAWAAPSATRTGPAQLGGATPPVYRWLASQPDGAVLEIPAAQLEIDFVGNARNARYMVASTTHWHPLVNGYTAYPPATDAFLLPAIRRLPAADALQRLVDAVDVRWLVLHRDALGPWERAQWTDALPPGLERIATFGDDEVYAITLPPRHDWRGEVLARTTGTWPLTLEGTSTAPLAPECRAGRIVSIDAPATMLPSLVALPVKVRAENASPCAWPASGVRADGLVRWTYRWTVPSGRTYDGIAPSRLLHDVAPGVAWDDTVMVQPGGGELGAWVLEVQLEQEGQAEPLARTQRTIVLEDWPRGG